MNMFGGNRVVLFDVSWNPAQVRPQLGQLSCFALEFGPLPIVLVTYC